MKDSERWDLIAKARYYQWKSYECEAKADDIGVLGDDHYNELIASYKKLEKSAKKLADRSREWEK